MSDLVGVELGADVVRAVVLGWRSRSRRACEIAWNPDRPEDAVALLREQLGPAGGIALSVGLAFLHPKVVKLPPAPPSERQRMLQLEPDRFFPVQGQAMAVSLASEQGLAFAAEADLMERWITAFEAWAPVRGVEPAPLSIARVLTRGGVPGVFSVPAAVGELGLIDVGEEGLRSARRMPASEEAPPTRPLPARDGLPGPMLAALGAALGVGQPLERMLLPRQHASVIGSRRTQRFSASVVAGVASVALALWAIDGARERVLQRIEGEVAAVTERAQRAVELRGRLAAMDREAAAIEGLGRGRADPLLVLAALSAQLPPDATVLDARATGNDWRIDGTAQDAAALVPLLDGDERFEDVRFLSASARYREGNRTYETFSIAFHARPAD